MQESYEYVEVYVQFNCTTILNIDRVLSLYCPIFYFQEEWAFRGCCMLLIQACILAHRMSNLLFKLVKQATCGAPTTLTVKGLMVMMGHVV